MSPKKRKARHQQPDESVWLTSFHEALCVIEDDILPVSDDDYMDSPMLQRAALGAFEEIRTAAQHLTQATLGTMPEVAAQDLRRGHGGYCRSR